MSTPTGTPVGPKSQPCTRRPTAARHACSRPRSNARRPTPPASVWVTAAAGTGKTRVLADRVLRLLVDWHRARTRSWA